MEAIVLAGGFGLRLQPVVKDVPKSMAMVNNRPFLEYLLDYLIQQGVDHTVLSVGYKRGIIQSHFKNRYRTMELDYAVEEEPLGTGGGIRLSFWRIRGERAVTMNGDSLFRIDLQAFERDHLAKKADVTLALRKLSDTGRYGRVSINRQRRITGFEEKKENAGQGLINAGVYFIEKAYLLKPHFRGRFSIEKDCFEQFSGTDRMFGYPAEGYFLDIGIPEDYQKAQHEFKGFEDR
ncbi:MAG: nucleotidyltransferase family protein [Bacteroidetes bacterium]|nr:nucleotidyltransferase family protein [Bacteroidota bacterium]